MKLRIILLGVVCLMFLSFCASASVFYVNAGNPAPATPFTTWATAATNIQDAIDAAGTGDTVLVTNGVYKTGVTAASRIAVQKLITVQSVNGPTTTIIQGQSSGSVRCAYLTNGATLSGFTLRNGYATGDGGGVYCLNANSILTNCIITGNSSKIEGGGGTRGSYFNCIINNNNAKQQGGGVYLGGTFNNCLIAGNSAAYGGGLQYPQALTNCTVAGNSATGGGGGGIAAGSGGPSAGIFRNCIVYYNVASSGGNNIMSASANSVSNCCTPDFYNKSCITNLPGMVDVRGGNYRL